MMASSSSWSAVAQTTLVTLVETFAFDAGLAAAAVEAIPDKGDVEVAIDWLLEHGAQDVGGAVTFKRCRHVEPEELCKSRAYGLPRCADCDEKVQEAWLCLYCGETRCGRYSKKHALDHFERTKHHLALGLADLSTWCYLCNAYVEHEAIDPLVETVRRAKFDKDKQKSPSQKHDDDREEEEDYFDAKVERLENMLHRARYAVLYTSGLSSSDPSTYRALARIFLSGILKVWINQDQDALPQRLGHLPEAKIIDIHGSNFDPSNPPVRDKVRPDVFEKLLCAEAEADLVLVLGADLEGMTADRVAGTVATRARAGLAQGTVLVNTKPTSFDDLAQLRIFEPVDDLIRALHTKLLPPPLSQEEPPTTSGVFPAFDAARGPLDLSTGSKIRLVGQPKWDICGNVGTIVGKDHEGNYLIDLLADTKNNQGVVRRTLGRWWLDDNNANHRLPVMLFSSILLEEEEEEEEEGEEEDEVKKTT